MRVLNRNEQKDIINSFKCTAKTHFTLDEKKIHPSVCWTPTFFDKVGRVAGNININLQTLHIWAGKF